jgi:thiosulfate dehydrogenase (quinone) large subunit
MRAQQMAPRHEKNLPLGYGLLRATLGLNICFHGISRIVQGPAVFANALVPMFARTPLPAGLVRSFGLTLPWVEALLGFLLLIGLWTRAALIGGALLIFVLTFGTALRQDWDTAGLQLIYAAVYATLLASHEHDAYSADALLSRRKRQ